MAMHYTIGRSKYGNIQWEDEYEQTFIEILEDYDDVITTILTGHSHRDFFRLLPNSLSSFFFFFFYIFIFFIQF